MRGDLAARWLMTGESYGSLVSQRLGGSFRAGLVNRLLYNSLGDRGYGWVTGWVSRSANVRGRARRGTGLLYFSKRAALLSSMLVITGLTPSEYTIT